MTASNGSNGNNGNNASPSWGAGLSQDDLMAKDTVLVLDDADAIIGTASKKEVHVFSEAQPHGILHRAFSVFLFDESDGRMLLQQRAATKITFPNVWTNTCCSHPLTGMEPSEIDTPADVAAGTVPGVKNAAIRKLQHELGLTFNDKNDDASSQFDSSPKFTFLTRLRYWACDTVTHGAFTAPWGEHEIDYVLFLTVPHKEDLNAGSDTSTAGGAVLQPHPDEVDDVRWVNPTELTAMLNDDTILFSPWFRLICHKWLLPLWWKDLEGCLTTQKYCDYDTIHEFDPPTEHYGGAGNAGPLFGGSNGGSDGASASAVASGASGASGEISAMGGDSSKKQGAYGKIQTHKESKLQQLSHADEVVAALTFLYVTPLKSNLQGSRYIRDTFHAADLAFCDEILVQVSRSFASVIRQLPDILLVDILVFYLVLRALDTIEDDTTAFGGDNAVKVQHLQAFCKTALTDPEWKMMGVGEGDERRLLEEFPACHRVFAALQPQSRRVIMDITQRMATGMAEFVGKDLGQGTTDLTQYNRYCHFVAGLVGEGLSRLFAASGLEKASFAGELHLSDQMGLFLQKTNIIRDYLEDYVDQRAFWPQSVWKKYSPTGDLGYFANQTDATAREKSIQLLNELVTDALELVPDCLAYLLKLDCQEIFRFCAIPQVMAIATLDKCYANPNVFTGVVKIRKGLSCKLILRTNNLAQVHDTFYQFAQSIIKHAASQRSRGVVDPSYTRTVRACETIMDLTESQARKQSRSRLMRSTVCTVPVVAAALLRYVTGRPAASDRSGGKGWQTAIQAGLVVSAVALYRWGPWTVRSNLTPADDLKKKTA